MNSLAVVFLLLMPFTFLGKTVTIAWATAVQSRQKPKYNLGRFIFWFFVALTFTSAGLTVLFAMLALRFHDATTIGEWLWWMLLVEFGSTAVTVLGCLMVRAQKKPRRLS